MDEKVYEQGRARALRVLTGRGYSLAIAEDAVQAAALYFVEHPVQKHGVTISLFVQRAMQRARDLFETAYGSDRPHAKARLVVHVGGASDLSNFESGSPVCTPDGDENN